MDGCGGAGARFRKIVTPAGDGGLDGGVFGDGHGC